MLRIFKLIKEMEKDERRTHISVQNTRLPSYGILQSENGISPSTCVLNMDIGMDSIPNDTSVINGNSNGMTLSNPSAHSVSGPG